MKRIISMAIGVLLLLGTAAFGQSLGEVARSARKGKTHQSAANHQYDDDNLPKNDHLSVVGPAPAASANGSNPTGEVSPQGQAAAQATATADKKAPAEERQRAAEEWKNKIDDKKQKVASLSHELELTQREYRLRAVAMYSDAGNRLRNSATWDKEDADFKKQLEDKQKAVDAAKQDLDNLTEQARKAGVRERE
ncbi:MAG TPA: hypothetical protein VF953_12645 [Terriglobales bacterium]